MGGHSDDIMALAYHQPSLVVSCSCDGQIIAYAARRNARAIPVQMWRRKPQSRRRCGCGASAVPAQMWLRGAPPAGCAVRPVHSGQRTRSAHCLVPMQFLSIARARACSDGGVCRRYNLDSGTIKFRMVLPMSYALSSRPRRAPTHRRSMPALPCARAACGAQARDADPVPARAVF